MATDPLARFTHLTRPPVDGSQTYDDGVPVVAFDRCRPSFWPGGALATVDWSAEYEEPEPGESED